MEIYSSNNQEQSRTRWALIAIGAAGVVFVIMIAALGTILAPKDNVQIVNGEGSSGDPISSADLSRVKNGVYSTVQTWNDVKGDDLEIAVRWDTMKKSGTEEYPSTIFLVDVDEYRQSYRVEVDKENVVVSCPTLGESKYPESYCHGTANEYDDSVSVVFGQLLPYQWRTSQGDGFIIERNGFDVEAPLFVQAFACDTDTAALERVDAAVDNLIMELGASPTLFGRKVEGINCEHSE